MLTFKQFLSEGYVAFILDPSTRQKLLTQFPPKFPEVYADYITYQFGVKHPDILPQSHDIQVVGYAANDALEVLVVSIDGDTKRVDGGIYHITWSLNQRRGVKPKDSNDLIKQGWEKVTPLPIQTHTEFKQ